MKTAADLFIVLVISGGLPLIAVNLGAYAVIRALINRKEGN
jgi:hypothetical protein